MLLLNAGRCCPPPPHHPPIHPPTMPAPQAMRAEQARQMQGAVARQVLEAIALVEARQRALMARQAALLQLCQQLLPQSEGSGGEGEVLGGRGGGSSSGGAETGRAVDLGGADCGQGLSSPESQQQQQQHQYQQAGGQQHQQQEAGEQQQQQKQEVGQQLESVQAKRATPSAPPGLQSTAEELRLRQHPAEPAGQTEEPLAPQQPLHQHPSMPVQCSTGLGTQQSHGPG